MGEKASMWNLWHGCHKLSEGCRHCYVYRTDGKYGKDSSVVTKTEKFDLPLQRKKNGTYKIPSGNLVYTCFTSDFLIEDADEWRAEAWEMMRIRQDLRFLFITKRIDRLQQCLPPDWGDGYDNVTICCTMENQDRVDYRLPIYKEISIKHKIIICEPLLSRIDFRGELGEWVEQVVAGGESGKEARVCGRHVSACAGARRSGRFGKVSRSQRILPSHSAGGGGENAAALCRVPARVCARL